MLQGPTADYPHASTACLCYLDRREGKEERNGDAGHRMLSLPHRMVHAVLPEKAESPEPDFSLALQSAVWSKLLWTASFRVEGPSPVQDDSCVVTKFNWHWKDWRGGGSDQSRAIVMVLFRGKSLFVPGLFKPAPGSSQSKWDF